MRAMPRPRPPGLHKETTRHGQTVFYVRRGKGPRVRIYGAYGSPEFRAAYEAAMRGETPKGKTRSNSLAWLISRYRESADWSRLAPATKSQRENILKHIEKKAGHEPFEEIDKASIVAGKDGRRETPHQANNFLKTMRGFFQWAVEAGHVKHDPTSGVRMVKVSSNGYETWSLEDVERFSARWPLGTRAHLAFAIMLCTGLRRGDACRLGPQHVRDGVIRITLEKTRTDLTIPLLPELKAVIDATKTGARSFIAKEDGEPMTKESFGEWFREVCEAAGVSARAHGLRKRAATNAAEAGASEAQLEAFFGWRGGKMASLYTKQAKRDSMAMDTGHKVLGKRRNPIPEP